MPENAKHAIKTYFDYINQGTPNGYQTETITGKLISGNTGGTKVAGSSVPAGVRFTDPDFIVFINKMDLVMDKLQVVNYQCYMYLILRYDLNASCKEIASTLGCSERSCRRLHKKGIVFVMDNIV